jgi:hypothetical protein
MIQLPPGITVIEPQQSQPPPLGGVLRRSFRVGRYTVTITKDLDAIAPGVSGQVNIVWHPKLPRKGTLSKAQIALYQQRRNEVLQEVANIIGGKVMVADV